jgi:hypothetical protein
MKGSRVRMFGWSRVRGFERSSREIEIKRERERERERGREKQHKVWKRGDAKQPLDLGRSSFLMDDRHRRRSVGTS